MLCQQEPDEGLGTIGRQSFGKLFVVELEVRYRTRAWQTIDVDPGSSGTCVLTSYYPRFVDGRDGIARANLRSSIKGVPGRLGVSGWTPEYVKLLVPPRQSGGIPCGSDLLRHHKRRPISPIAIPQEKIRFIVVLHLLGVRIEIQRSAQSVGRVCQVYQSGGNVSFLDGSMEISFFPTPDAGNKVFEIVVLGRGGRGSRLLFFSQPALIAAVRLADFVPLRIVSVAQLPMLLENRDRGRNGYPFRQ